MRRAAGRCVAVRCGGPCLIKHGNGHLPMDPPKRVSTWCVVSRRGAERCGAMRRDAARRVALRRTLSHQHGGGHCPWTPRWGFDVLRSGALRSEASRCGAWRCVAMRCEAWRSVVFDVHKSPSNSPGWKRTTSPNAVEGATLQLRHHEPRKGIRQPKAPQSVRQNPPTAKGTTPSQRGSGLVESACGLSGSCQP